MATMFVTAEALNVRSAPDSQQNNIIGKVYLTQRVETLNNPSPGWVEIDATNANFNGPAFVSTSFLRPPTTRHREALIASVSREYFRFSRGQGEEHVAPYSGFVGEMWQAIGINLDGTDRDTPWSAAAISFFVRNAGPAYANFMFAAAHSKYIHQAVRARLDGDNGVPFWGFRLHEERPAIGDIVARDNPNFAPAVTYDVAAQQDAYRSHTDVIVHIDSAQQRAVAIGGNVSHSVQIAYYNLAPGDFLASTNHTFALLRNITDG